MPAARVKTGKVTKPQKPRARQQFDSRKAAATKKVALDSLSWRPVDLPDRLEDAEGFYGLEEIDDVEINRDEQGNIEYLIPSRDEPNGRAEPIEESEWEGFEDTESPQQLPEPTPKEPKKSQKKSKSAREALNRPPVEPVASEEAVKADVSAWSRLGLRLETLDAIARLGFAKPTPIQQCAVPAICRGRDVVGKAPTGSGKTLAYGIPILEYILQHGCKDKSAKQFAPTAFIISPTRELAKQLEDHLRALCMHAAGSVRIATVTGGLSVQKQQRQLLTADIVIGTPGRLWDVFNSNAELFEGLRKIKFLVIDEADRLLSTSHFKEVEDILHGLDRVEDSETDDDDTSRRQTLVFSATFERDLQQKLAGKRRASDQKGSMAYLIDKLKFRDPAGKPSFLDTNPGGESQLAPLLKEAMLECRTADKDLYLYASLLLQPPNTKTIVFANSINTVRQVTLFLQALQLPAHALHSQMVQKSRLKALERFSTRKPPVPASQPDAQAPISDPGLATTSSGPILVATDVAARGLDIPAVQLVLHYHIPRTADSYIHRSGRTARGDASGTTLLLCSPDEVVPVQRLVSKVHAQQKKQRNATGLRSARIDRTVAGRLRARVNLATRIAYLETDAARTRSRNNFMREAADDLGVELSEDEVDSDEGAGGKRNGKGKNGAAESKRLRAELRELLRRRVNVGVSETYLTSGGVNVDMLLKGETGTFIGNVNSLIID